MHNTVLKFISNISLPHPFLSPMERGKVRENSNIFGKATEMRLSKPAFSPLVMLYIPVAFFPNRVSNLTYYFIGDEYFLDLA